LDFESGAVSSVTYTRPVKIYTRRGDSGDTDLFGGVRVGKEHQRVEAYGAVDELNAFVGVCAAASTHDDLRAICCTVQGLLFDLGGYLASPDERRREKSAVPEPGAEDVDVLEQDIDSLEAELAPLQRFILPGGTPAAAAFHVARTVCRRAERRTVELHRSETLSEASLRYLNRLSDLLFVMARVENARSGVGDVEWVGRER
jgi:cob(I)alamin adenosyltransferase